MNVYCIILLTFSLCLKNFKILNNFHPRTKKVDHNIIYQVIIVVLGLA